jgi:hypothetical protein
MATLPISNTGLLLYYPFDTDLRNYATGTGVDNGTASGCAISNNNNSGVNSSGSLYFNGLTQNQRFKIDTVPRFTSNTGGVTFSLWVKFEKVPPANQQPNFRLFAFENQAEGAGNGKLNVLFQNQNTAVNYLLITPTSDVSETPLLHNKNKITMNDNIWHHYCLTISPYYTDPTGYTYQYDLNFYLDGLNVMNKTYGYNPSYPYQSGFETCLIGQSNFSSDQNQPAGAQPQFYVNNFLLFQRTLTPSEVSTLYTSVADTKLTSIRNLHYWGLICYYPFENDLLNYATGTGVDDDTTAFQEPALSTEASRYEGGKSLKTGSTSYFNGRNIKLLQSGFTIAVWMKLYSSIVGTTYDYARVFDLGLIGNQNAGGTIKITIGFDKYSMLYVVAGGGFKGGPYKGFTPDFNWHHYCLVVNTNGQLSLYIDGMLQYQQTADYNTFFSPNAQFTGVCLGHAIDTPMSAPIRTPAYYNSFIIYNRPITYREIGLILGLKNTVLNGDFNLFQLANDPRTHGFDSDNGAAFKAAVNGSSQIESKTNIVNGKFMLCNANSTISDPSYAEAYVSNRITGWDINFSNLAYYTYIGINTGNNTSTDNNYSNYLVLNPAQGGINKLASQQHTMFIAQSTKETRNLITLTQSIYLTPGSYILNYKFAGRYYPTDLVVGTNSGSKLKYKLYDNSSVLQSRDFVGISSAFWTTAMNQPIVISKSNIYTLEFTFDFMQWTQASGFDITIKDSTIFLTDVEIVPIINNYKAGSVSLTSPNVRIQTGLSGLTDVIPNNLAVNKYKNSDGTGFFENAPFYMHGPKYAIGFKVDGVDIGHYLQQSAPFDASYGYCFSHNYYAIIFSGQIGTDFLTFPTTGNPYYIWPENQGHKNQQIGIAADNASYWLYHTFYYSGSENVGYMYAAKDDFACVYFNNVLVISTVSDNAYQKQSDSITKTPITILNGLNYIRVAVYNAAAAAPGAFIASFFDSLNNVLAVTNQNWTWSIHPQTVTDLYYSPYGSLTFNGIPETDFTIKNAMYYTYKNGIQTFIVITATSYLETSGSITFNSAIDASYIVVGGGGAGGQGSWQAIGGTGGGGGGISYGSISLTANTSYPFSVGIGGLWAYNASTAPTTGGNSDTIAGSGQSSSFSGIMAYGGNGGRGGGNISNSVGGAGGTIFTGGGGTPLTGGTGGTAGNSIGTSSGLLPVSVKIHNVGYSKLSGGGAGGGANLTSSNTSGGGAGGAALNGGGSIQEPKFAQHGLPNTGGGGGGGGNGNNGIGPNYRGGNGGSGVIVLYYAELIARNQYYDYTTTSTVTIPEWCNSIRYIIQYAGANSTSGPVERYNKTGSQTIEVTEYRSANNISTVTQKVLQTDGVISGKTQYDLTIWSDIFTDKDEGAYQTVKIIEYYYGDKVTVIETQNGAGGTCHTGVYNNTVKVANNTITINVGSAPYIQFNDGQNSNVPSNITSKITNTQTNGSVTNSGFVNDVYNMTNFVPNIDSYYGKGGTASSSGGPPIIRLWFMT